VAPEAQDERSTTHREATQIRRAIAERREAAADKAILDRAGLQKLWTEIAQDGEEATRDRLAATKLLGASDGLFLTRHEHSGSVTAEVKAVLEESPAQVEDRVVEALDPKLWERIQARVGEGRDSEEWDSTGGGG
jgi:hypothetical protein